MYSTPATPCRRARTSGRAIVSDFVSKNKQKPPAPTNTNTPSRRQRGCYRTRHAVSTEEGSRRCTVPAAARKGGNRGGRGTGKVHRGGLLRGMCGRLSPTGATDGCRGQAPERNETKRNQPAARREPGQRRGGGAPVCSAIGDSLRVGPGAVAGRRSREEAPGAPLRPTRRHVRFVGHHTAMLSESWSPGASGKRQTNAERKPLPDRNGQSGSQKLGTSSSTTVRSRLVQRQLCGTPGKR